VSCANLGQWLTNIIEHPELFGKTYDIYHALAAYKTPEVKSLLLSIVLNDDELEGEAVYHALNWLPDDMAAYYFDVYLQYYSIWGRVEKKVLDMLFASDEHKAALIKIMAAIVADWKEPERGEMEKVKYFDIVACMDLLGQVHHPQLETLINYLVETSGQFVCTVMFHKALDFKFPSTVKILSQRMVERGNWTRETNVHAAKALWCYNDPNIDALIPTELLSFMPADRVYSYTRVEY